MSINVFKEGEIIFQLQWPPPKKSMQNNEKKLTLTGESAVACFRQSLELTLVSVCNEISF